MQVPLFVITALIANVFRVLLPTIGLLMAHKGQVGYARCCSSCCCTGCGRLVKDCCCSCCKHLVREEETAHEKKDVEKMDCAVKLDEKTKALAVGISRYIEKEIHRTQGGVYISVKVLGCKNLCPPEKSALTERVALSTLSARDPFVQLVSFPTKARFSAFRLVPAGCDSLLFGRRVEPDHAWGARMRGSCFHGRSAAIAAKDWCLLCVAHARGAPNAVATLLFIAFPPPFSAFHRGTAAATAGRRPAAGWGGRLEGHDVDHLEQHQPFVEVGQHLQLPGADGQRQDPAWEGKAHPAGGYMADSRA